MRGRRQTGIDGEEGYRLGVITWMAGDMERRGSGQTPGARLAPSPPGNDLGGFPASPGNAVAAATIADVL